MGRSCAVEDEEVEYTNGVGHFDGDELDLTEEVDDDGAVEPQVIDWAEEMAVRPWPELVRTLDRLRDGRLRGVPITVYTDLSANDDHDAVSDRLEEVRDGCSLRLLFGADPDDDYALAGLDSDDLQAIIHQIHTSLQATAADWIVGVRGYIEPLAGEDDDDSGDDDKEDDDPWERMDECGDEEDDDGGAAHVLLLLCTRRRSPNADALLAEAGLLDDDHDEEDQDGDEEWDE